MSEIGYHAQCEHTRLANSDVAKRTHGLSPRCREHAAADKVGRVQMLRCVHRDYSGKPSTASVCALTVLGCLHCVLTAALCALGRETMVEELGSGEAQLFDVREPQEAMMGKLKASILVPLSELQEGMPPSSRSGADPSKLTYLHCAAGIRVHPSAQLLEAMGFERVVPLQEGFATLAQLGFELEG